MRSNKMRLCLLCVLLLVFVCGCDSDELGGVPVTPEMLESVSRSLEQSTSVEPDSTKFGQGSPAETDSVTTAADDRIVPYQTTAETHTPESSSAVVSSVTGDSVVEPQETTISDVVYWTENGSVYHIKSTCSSLQKSAKIIQGSVEEAISANKERACKRCS